jgi:hypothetical protein
MMLRRAPRRVPQGQGNPPVDLRMRCLQSVALDVAEKIIGGHLVGRNVRQIAEILGEAHFQAVARAQARMTHDGG